jgi:pimeloyl-ACP methyl ester carboxylesterase/DNA-binding winged helix-turn-helix (wHTH) protein
VQYLFENQILDVERRELRRGSDVVILEPLVFDLLVYLVRHRDRVVSKDDLIASVWGGRIVSDSTLDSRVNAVRKAIGDSGGEQKLIRTLSRKGVRFVGAVEEKPNGLDHNTVQTSKSAAEPLRQEIRFCRASDGVRLAYSCIGNGPPLIKTGNWMTHLEWDLDSPIWRHLYRDLSKEHMLIRYDSRGNGLSDRDVDDISFDAFVRDLEAVTDAAGFERFSLLGISQGCGVSVAYAARHPERVERLVLYGGYVQGWHKRAKTEAEKQEGAAMCTLMRLGWGQENPAFRQLFTSQFIPGATKEQADWFNELQRVSASPESAVRNFEANGLMDVTKLLPLVTAPTLVVHARDEVRVPFDNGRRLAAGIPGARFVPLDSRNHLVLEDEPAYPRFIEEITSFLRG